MKRNKKCLNFFKNIFSVPFYCLGLIFSLFELLLEKEKKYGLSDSDSNKF